MSNTRRPTLVRKVTKTTEKERKAALDEGVTMTVDGREYTVTAGDLSGLDVAALRREVGVSFQGLLTQLGTDPDVDLIAALMWLARRIAGEKTLTYDEVAESVGYDIDIEIKETTDGADSPEV